MGKKKPEPEKVKAPQLELGWKVKDVVSGIVGILIARIEYLNGCIQYCVVPPYTPGAVEVSSFYIDEVQLVKISDGVKATDVPIIEPRTRSYGANIKPPSYGGRRS